MFANKPVPDNEQFRQCTCWGRRVQSAGCSTPLDSAWPGNSHFTFKMCINFWSRTNILAVFGVDCTYVHVDVHVYICMPNYVHIWNLQIVQSCQNDFISFTKFIWKLKWCLVYTMIQMLQILVFVGSCVCVDTLICHLNNHT